MVEMHLQWRLRVDVVAPILLSRGKASRKSQRNTMLAKLLRNKPQD